MRNAVICCIAVALIGLVFLTTNLVCVSATTGSENVVPKLDQDLTTTVIAGIKNNYSKIVSGKGAFRVEQHFDVEPFHPDVRDYTLVFDREKFKECRSWGVDQEHMTPDTECYFDGNTSGFYGVPENRATVWNGWSDPIVSSSISSKLGFPFTYEKLAPTLIDQISTSNAQVVGEVVVDGIKCYRLEGRSPSGQKVKWDVAPDYGFVVVRHITELQETEEPGSKYKSARYEIVNSDFAQFDGVWLPRQQEAGAIYTLVDDSVTTKPMYSFKVTSLDINVTVDPGLFRPNFTADTAIYMKK